MKDIYSSALRASYGCLSWINGKKWLLDTGSALICHHDYQTSCLIIVMNHSLYRNTWTQCLVENISHSMPHKWMKVYLLIWPLQDQDVAVVLIVSSQTHFRDGCMEHFLLVKSADTDPKQSLNYTHFCAKLGYGYYGWSVWSINYPDSKVLGANVGPIWGRQDPGGPHVGPMNFAIYITLLISQSSWIKPMAFPLDAIKLATCHQDCYLCHSNCYLPQRWRYLPLRVGML